MIMVFSGKIPEVTFKECGDKIIDSINEFVDLLESQMIIYFNMAALTVGANFIKLHEFDPKNPYQGEVPATTIVLPGTINCSNKSVLEMLKSDNGNGHRKVMEHMLRLSFFDSQVDLFETASPIGHLIADRCLTRDNVDVVKQIFDLYH
tara:strand:- start:236 stop:682 length:447 start_codon:yes stop_codon:yes gene_type:complete